MTTDKMQPFGEVTEGTLSSVKIQVYDPGKAPEFGEVARIVGGAIDVVCAIQASSMEPVDVIARIPKPLKLSRERLLQAYPDLSEKMRLTQTLYVLGYTGQSTQVSHRLPPHAPLVHDLAVKVESSFVREFHRRSDGFRVDYMSRLLEDDSIEYPIDFAGALLSNVVAILDKSEREQFLLQVLETYQKAVAPRISARMISELVERLK